MRQPRVFCFEMKEPAAEHLVKVRQKISGCLRTEGGAERFCRIRGYIATLRKQDVPIFAALSKMIAGAPPVPAIAWTHGAE